ncbi:hypothetical protein OE88DRAFT_1645282 [Heliocybe sulcata]|uniref:Ubiquitin 3 binding protein But2 C-terminal domain-containing protein n=1 Tax=Heliocybe sulcata TaxID=5364 RepID=A0A5C3N1Y6_9AGAM|nr:hypothetical protein OE88DRAFT_1645282 [Heliocybe sulcata]
MSSSDNKYEALPLVEDEQSRVEEITDYHVRPRILRGLEICVYVCTALTALAACILLGVHLSVGQSVPVELDPYSLPFRSTNHARVLAHVSSSEPEKVFEVWPDYELHHSGYVPLAREKLWVTDEASPSLNLCLVLDLPSQFSKGSGTDLSVWVLSTEERLDFKHLSWKTKPPRKYLLGYLSAVPGMSDMTSHFSCASMSYQTFEISCAATPCQINYTQGKLYNEQRGNWPMLILSGVLLMERLFYLRVGIYLLQSQTV